MVSEDALTVVECVYPERDDLPIRMIALDDEPWISAHDLAAAAGFGGRYQRLTFAAGANSRVELPTHRLSGQVRGPDRRRTAWFISEDAALRWLYREDVADAVALRRWLVREALPAFRGSALPCGGNLQAFVHTERQRTIARRRKRKRQRPTALYRFYDDSGNLLYVGISVRLAQRISHHTRVKSWWHHVADIRPEMYPNRVAALAAEVEAIRNEHPRYNIRGVQRGA